MELPQPEDIFDERLLGHIRKLGWGVIHVPADAEGPGFSFSVGFYYSWQHPELLLMGLKPETAQAILSIAAETIQKGGGYPAGQETGDFLEGYSCRLHEIPRPCYPDYLGYARWLYGGDHFPALQVLWPDKEGRFPGEEDFASPEAQQRLLSRESWPGLAGPVAGLP